MSATIDNYIPYGPEWEAHLMKLPKKFIIDLLRKKGETESIPDPSIEQQAEERYQMPDGKTLEALLGQYECQRKREAFIAGAASQSKRIEELEEALGKIKQLSNPDTWSFSFCGVVQSIASEALNIK